MSLKHKLIELLSDGKFHSGEELGKALNLTRAAIWKMITPLKDLGIEVYSVKGKGYRIPNSFELLNCMQIKSLMPISIGERIELEVLTEVDSTNQYLLTNQQTTQKIPVVLAEYQSKGRGRRHRNWHSPYGANLYLSLKWNFDKDPSELNGLSLAVGVAVANTLERYGIPLVQLKWPNDILWGYKKIAGILLEMTAETHCQTQVVIGIGINVQMPPSEIIEQPWIDIAAIIAQRPERNRLAAYLIQEVIDTLTLFQTHGFAKFIKYWQLLDAYYNKPVIIITPSAEFRGIAKGINNQGEFLLCIEGKQEMRFLHGEVSLRLDVSD